MRQSAIAVLCLLLMAACDGKSKVNDELMVVNNSAIPIGISASWDYPDTLNYTMQGCPSNDIGRTVSPHMSKCYCIFSSWEPKFKENPAGVLMFLAYNADSAKRLWDLGFGCDSLEKRPDLLLKRWDITLDQIQASGWKLTYP